MFDQERKVEFPGTGDTTGPIIHQRWESQGSAKDYFFSLLKKEHNESSRLPVQTSFNNARNAFMHDAARHWKTVFHFINSVLDDMDRGLLRGEDIRENLSAWRAVLGTCRYQIVQYQGNLQDSLEILENPKAPDLVRKDYSALLTVAKEIGEREIGRAHV